MNLIVEFVCIKANDKYFEALRNLDKIVETEHFQEYVHKEKQIYVRHDKRIELDSNCLLFIEPQINMSRSIRHGFGFAAKLQFSVIKHFGVRGHQVQGIDFFPYYNPLSSADFIEGLEMCPAWKNQVRGMLQEIDNQLNP